MAPTLQTPSERTCERCGRVEVWEESTGTWRLAVDESGDPQAVGSPYCIHEWDINGSFAPFEGDAAEA